MSEDVETDAVYTLLLDSLVSLDTMLRDEQLLEGYRFLLRVTDDGTPELRLEDTSLEGWMLDTRAMYVRGGTLNVYDMRGAVLGQVSLASPEWQRDLVSLFMAHR